MTEKICQRRLALLGSLGLLTFIPGFAAQAHPGHGWAEHGLSHLLRSPDHLTLLAIIGLGLFVAGRLLRRRLPRFLLQASGLGAFLAGLLLGLNL